LPSFCASSWRRSAASRCGAFIGPEVMPPRGRPTTRHLTMFDPVKAAALLISMTQQSPPD
jgi:hypothetical protein